MKLKTYIQPFFTRYFIRLSFVRIFLWFLIKRLNYKGWKVFTLSQHRKLAKNLNKLVLGLSDKPQKHEQTHDTSSSCSISVDGWVKAEIDDKKLISSTVETLKKCRLRN